MRACHFSEYVRALASGVFQASGAGAERIRLALEVEPVSLSVDRAIPCGLILNELIANAVKHAFPHERHGCIQVDLRKLEASILLSVRDDGIGVAQDFAPKKAKSLGMQLIVTLVTQLRGRLEISVDRGTTFRVTFPAEPAS